MTLSAILAVFRFEWKRSLTIRQWLGFVMLMLVPPLICGLMRRADAIDGTTNSREIYSRVIFYLIPEVLCLLSLLLVMTSVVFGELEGKNWVYIATRPYGRTTHLLGKYFAGVSRTILCATLAMLLTMARRCITTPKKIKIAP